jgi:hypothetical protein
MFPTNGQLLLLVGGLAFVVFFGSCVVNEPEEPKPRKLSRYNIQPSKN